MRFVVIGDGHLRAELEGHARALGLLDDVKFAGLRDDPENFYPALDVVALTSRNEGTPLTLIEAMANARACVATAVGGVVDLLGGVAADELRRAAPVAGLRARHAGEARRRRRLSPTRSRTSSATRRCDSAWAGAAASTSSAIIRSSVWSPTCGGSTGVWRAAPTKRRPRRRRCSKF